MMERPNPTVEKSNAYLEIQREALRHITLENCPYFQATLVESDSRDGAKIAHVDCLQILFGHALRIGLEENAEQVGDKTISRPLKLPDQISIYPKEGGELYRVTIAATHFFVTEHDELCCLAPREKSIYIGEGITHKERLTGQDIWVLLENKTPDDLSPLKVLGEEKLFFPYARIRDAVRERNQKWGVALPDELQKIIQKKWSIGAPQSANIAHTNAFTQVLYFTGDNIHRAAITAYARAAQWQDGEDYFKGLQQEYSNLKITVSLPNGEKAASLWEFLRRGGAATVKAHYALWARYYEQVPDGLQMQDVLVNINDFCRDLGYTKNKGAYKPEHKRRAMQLLEALTTTEMAATYQVPGAKTGQTKTRRLKGTIWRRGLEAEERDTYEDLFGQTRTGDPGQWIPQSFSFSPGAWHTDQEWRRHNKYVGKIGAGLMRLDVRYDEWAILIGGYLGTLARTGKYCNRRLKISTILENTGLATTDTHRKTEHREKFYRALDRLQEEKIIITYKTEGFDDSDVDPDDLEALAEYGARDPFPQGDWRASIVEITFDFAADMQRLETRKMKAITARAKRAKTKKENKK